jgi:flagellar motility protein MotE (MotC chaperone)
LYEGETKMTEEKKIFELMEKHSPNSVGRLIWTENMLQEAISWARSQSQAEIENLSTNCLRFEDKYIEATAKIQEKQAEIDELEKLRTEERKAYHDERLKMQIDIDELKNELEHYKNEYRKLGSLILGRKFLEEKL